VGGEVESGLIVGTIGSICVAAVQYLIHRARMRAVTRGKELDTSSMRDRRALAAEDQAFTHLTKVVEDLRKENDDLEQELRDVRRAFDTDLRAIREAAAETIASLEQRLREALDDAAAIRNTWQGSVTKHEIESGALKAEIEAYRWREKEAVLCIRLYAAVHKEVRRRVSRRGEADLPEEPRLPHWVDPPADPEPPHVEERGPGKREER
jgi:predicted RNase H-like nuclease (RuvC/YqgF family)